MSPTKLTQQFLAQMSPRASGREGMEIMWQEEGKGRTAGMEINQINPHCCIRSILTGGYQIIPDFSVHCCNSSRGDGETQMLP